MDSLLVWLQGQPLVSLFAVLTVGLLLGRLAIRGVSIGSSGVLFAALLGGVLGLDMMPGIGTLGLVLFVYGVGVTAGPGFVAALRRRGKSCVWLAMAAVGSGALLMIGFTIFTSYPRALLAGLFAGALTSTPALAAAMDSADPGLVSVGYGIAYPFGVIGVVLFVQFVPRLLGTSLEEAGHKLEAATDSALERRLMKLTQDEWVGRACQDAQPLLDEAHCCISRVMRAGRLLPIAHTDVFEKGAIYLVIGRESALSSVIGQMGEIAEGATVMDADHERMDIVVSSSGLAGRVLGALRPLQTFGIIVPRINRYGVDWVPHSQTRLLLGDRLTAVGSAGDLHQFARLAGNRQQLLNTTDLAGLGIGLLGGTLVGLLPIPLPGLPAIQLGLAGGPLLAGLALGARGQFGKIRFVLPAPARLLLMDLGLVLFLAQAGMRAGGRIMPVLDEYGWPLILIGAVMTLVPMALTFGLALKLAKMNVVEALGAVCGGMTSTPALGVIRSKVDAATPAALYASAYPIALVLMTLAARFLIRLL